MSSSIAAGIRAGSSCKQAQLVGMFEEVHDSVADQAGGGVVAGDDELEQAAEQLLFRQALVVVGRRHQHADEIVLVVLPVGCDEAFQ